MCTLIILYGFLKGFPILAVHNRYAPVGSVEEPPRVSKGRFRVYHPLDSHSRGTWIGFNEKGLFAAVTDQHTNGTSETCRSRGLLLLDFLTSFPKASEALNYLKRELAKGYRRGNFILADSEEAYHILHDEKLEVKPLNHGVYVFTNLTVKDWVKMEKIPEDLLISIEMRRRRALEITSKLKPTDLNQLIEELKLIASDHGSELGRSSICYHNGVGWYMLSSTIMAVADNSRDSKILYCRGNPCEDQFIDYSHILFNGDAVEVSVESKKLAGRRIALCLTGSVASIEAPKLARDLRRQSDETGI